MRFLIIAIFVLCFISYPAYGEIVEDRTTARKETPDIKLPDEIDDYPFHWFKLNKEESKRIIFADLTGDGIDEIIIATLGKDNVDFTPEARTSLVNVLYAISWSFNQ